MIKDDARELNEVTKSLKAEEKRLQEIRSTKEKLDREYKQLQQAVNAKKEKERRHEKFIMGGIVRKILTEMDDSTRRDILVDMIKEYGTKRDLKTLAGRFDEFADSAGKRPEKDGGKNLNLSLGSIPKAG